MTVPKIFLKIGIGGVIGNELMTFDFCKGERLKPYVSKILGRDFKYKFKREFVSQVQTAYKKRFYDDQEMRAITFKLERHVVYEYKRFAGNTLGEIEEGYFVILSDSIKELEYEEVEYWCATAKEKEKLKKKRQLELFEDSSKYAPDDIDF
jgi:hypothetical protein